MFYYLVLLLQGTKRSIDVQRLLGNSQRYLYSFGTNDFGNRPTIVPVNTLDCNDPEIQQNNQPLDSCTNPDTGEQEECRVPLELPTSEDDKPKQKKRKQKNKFMF